MSVKNRERAQKKECRGAKCQHKVYDSYQTADEVAENFKTWARQGGKYPKPSDTVLGCLQISPGSGHLQGWCFGRLEAKPSLDPLVRVMAE